MKAPVAAADTCLPVSEDIQREAEAGVEDRPYGIHTRLGNASVSCRELSGRKIRKTLGPNACTICGVVELRELAARFICKRNERIPSQARVEGQAARHLEVIFHVQARRGSCIKLLYSVVICVNALGEP